ncbi:phosphatidate cytidylyltransferase [Mobilicoccus massiliensis]|uniref:phosphatidate cytidylyltransferase n=1 Tax=Mobilicoccus massiliensis TaxID=1522310 RepID=UPI00058CBA8B|nr:phosphatidate cytidylyltransferase [Mobilicoccus massiliensis]
MTIPVAPAKRPPGKAGRNLPVAIGVGLGLGALVLASLFIVRWGWLVLVVPAISLGVWELARAFAAGRFHVPVVPVMVGTVAMHLAAYLSGGPGLMMAFGMTLLAVVAWRSVQGIDGAARDVTAGVFVAAYAPFLSAFTSLMLAQPDGPRRVAVFILVTICSDIGGYAVGVVAGRHPMAPSVSPKKSWEGALGSLVGCLVAGMISVPLILGGSLWAGALLGLLTVLMATLGDLTESMLKRDLGVKDLGHLLPGHGGLMDRIDSLLVTAPVAWFVFSLLV